MSASIQKRETQLLVGFDHDGRALHSRYLLNTPNMKTLRQRLVEKENVYSNFVVPRRSRKEGGPFNNGPWSDTERLLFLKGLRMFGVGHWKEIGTILTTRSNRQIKSHGQKITARMEKGENVFELLEQAKKNWTAPESPQIHTKHTLRSSEYGMPTLNQHLSPPLEQILPVVATAVKSTNEDVNAARLLCQLKATPQPSMDTFCLVTPSSL